MVVPRLSRLIALLWCYSGLPTDCAAPMLWWSLGWLGCSGVTVSLGWLGCSGVTVVSRLVGLLRCYGGFSASWAALVLRWSLGWLGYSGVTVVLSADWTASLQHTLCLFSRRRALIGGCNRLRCVAHFCALAASICHLTYEKVICVIVYTGCHSYLTLYYGPGEMCDCLHWLPFLSHLVVHRTGQVWQFAEQFCVIL